MADAARSPLQPESALERSRDVRACLTDNDLSELFEGRLPPAARAELEEHLSECSDCHGLVAQATPFFIPSHRGGSTVPAAAKVAEVPGVSLARGAQIGRYLVLEPVGRGGMGMVYAAYDSELDRRVALKLLRSD